jgi:uncharacterized membrane protein
MKDLIFIYSLGILLVLSFSAYAYYKIPISFSIKLNNSTSFSIVIILTAIYIVVFSILKDLTFQSHHSYLDFSAYLEIFDKYSKGEGLYSSLEKNHLGTGHWLGIHFTPLAFLFGEIFEIFPSFYTINWLNTILLGMTPICIFLQIRKHSNNLEATLFSISILFNPTFQYITLYEFDFLRFLIPIGVVSLGYILLNNKYNQFLLLLLLVSCLLIREDASIFVFGIGCYLFLIGKKYYEGLFITSISLVYFIYVNYILMPSLREINLNTNFAAFWFNTFGSNPLEIFINIINSPIEFIKFFFNPIKIANVVMLLLPFLFIGIFSPYILLICIFSLSLLLLSATHTHVSYFLYYVSPIFVVIIWATYFGVINLAVKIKSLNSKYEIKTKLFFSILIGSVTSSIYFGPSPISVQFWFSDFKLAPFETNTFFKNRYEVSSHDYAIRDVALLIPFEASVSTEQHLIGEVYRNKSIYGFPYIEGAEYILIDKKINRKRGLFIDGSWDGLKKYPQFYYDWVEKRPDVYELIKTKDSVYLYKKRENAPVYKQPRTIPDKQY